MVDLISNFSSFGALEDMLVLLEAEAGGLTNDDGQGLAEFVKQMMADFDRADLDGDGTINFSEYVRKVWGEMEMSDHEPPTLRQLRRQFKQQDLNGDGKISRQEFQILAEKCYFHQLAE